MNYIGLDSGSTTTKGILFRENVILNQQIMATAGNPRKAIATILDTFKEQTDFEDTKIITTGYGRKLFPADLVLTEITCHGKGARFLHETAKYVIDIGGQDCKAIALNDKGAVMDFNMNDRCAAGTGRFVEVMMQALGENISELDKFVENAVPVPINSMCTVFAESEIVSLVAKEEPRENIALGVLHGIAKRVSNQYNKLQAKNDGTILFTGGLSGSKQFIKVLSEYISVPIVTHDLAQYAGAIGAAVIGSNKLS
ncbi:hypothetical protein GIX45_25130 [Erwinia sp. CPCC 100877]|nr:hypothetical protein [Erwinia sp. CPCC 100877]